MRELTKPQIISMDAGELDEFAEQWRTDMTFGTIEARKAYLGGL